MECEWLDCKEEADAIIEEYSKLSVVSGLFLDAANTPCILLKDHSFVKDIDGCVNWAVDIKALGAHVFIFLTTGTDKKDTIVVPICLLDTQSRLAAKILLDTTRNEKGQFNSRDAEFKIVDSKHKGFKVKVNLAPLSLMYIEIETFPKSFWLHLKSEHCPFCNPARPQNTGEFFG